MKLYERKEIIEIIKEKSNQYGIDWRLVYAIMQVESGGNQVAMRYEPIFRERYIKKLNLDDKESFLRSCSFGLMQLMGQKAYELGHNGDYEKLLEADTNIDIACRFLKELKDKYQERRYIISAYNGGLRKQGRYYIIYNEPYVNKVENKLKELEEI